jgi:hypothetical protein
MLLSIALISFNRIVSDNKAIIADATMASKIVTTNPSSDIHSLLYLLPSCVTTSIKPKAAVIASGTIAAFL